MCELLSLSFDQPTSASPFLQSFGARSEQNADGWGLAWYDGPAVAVTKEPVRWTESRLSAFLANAPDLMAPLYLAHVRDGTTGQNSLADTHPFSREMGGRDYVFAHNGTISGPIWDSPLGRFQPVGATDSERFFCLLLDQIDQRGGVLDDVASWRWLHRQLVEWNSWGTLNVLLSDGQRMFAYHDVKRWKGLAFRTMPENGVIVATSALDDEEWTGFEPGELLVLEAGRIRYSSAREVADPLQSVASNRTGGRVCTA